MTPTETLSVDLLFRILGFGLTVGGMLFFLALGFVFPRTKPAIEWKETWLNVASGGMLYVLRTALLLGVGFLVGARSGGLIPLGFLSGSVLLQFVVTFLILDFARYWVHRWGHRVPILWKVHRTHHCSEHINATSGLRMHAVDMVLLALTPVVLFELLFDISAFEAWVLPATMLVGIAFDSFEHANIRFDMTKPWNRAWNLVLNNPHFHAWHHTIEGKEKDGNYGQTLTLWDRLFGSDVTEPELPPAYGIVAWDSLEMSFLGLHLLRPRQGAEKPPST